MESYERTCPQCDSSNGKVKFPARLKPSVTRQSRKAWQGLSYNMLLCRECDLIYSSPVQPVQWSNSEPNIDVEIYAAKTYFHLLRKYVPTLNQTSSCLEIGASTGQLLKLLKESGVNKLYAFEPNIHSAKKIEDDVRVFNCQFSFKEVAKEKFDLIVINQTLEHMENPASLLKECQQLLNKYGYIMLINHDYQHFCNRLLGRYSPIVDIEHFQIWNQITLQSLLKRIGYKIEIQKGIYNTYPLYYWLSLLPFVGKLFEHFTFLNFPVTLSVGNFVTFGRK